MQHYLTKIKHLVNEITPIMHMDLRIRCKSMPYFAKNKVYTAVYAAIFEQNKILACEIIPL